MKRRSKSAFLMIITLLVIVIVIRGLTKMKGIKVTMIQAENGVVEDYYSEEGVLTLGHDYAVITKISGHVKEINVRESTQVKEGDILFILDDRDIQYEKSRYESTLEGLRAQLEQSRINQLITSSPQEYLNTIKREMDTKAADFQSAKTVYEANNVLYENGGVSRLEWEQSKAAYSATQAEWQQSQERYNQSQELLAKLSESGIDETTINKKFYDSAIQVLESEIDTVVTVVAQLEEKLGDCIAIADRSGIVTSVPISEMSSIQEGATAVVISCHEYIQVQAEVLTSIAPYLNEGDPVDIIIKLRGGDVFYSGKINQVFQYASKGTSALGLDEYRVRVKVDLEDGFEVITMDGYDVTIRFLLYSQAEKLWIPSSAIFRTENQDFVFLVSENRAIKQKVELEYQTGTQAIVKSGLEIGDIVINNVDGEGIYDGVKVYK